MEQLDAIMKTAEKHMKTTIEKVESELATIRTGKASPSILDSVKVRLLRHEGAAQAGRQRRRPRSEAHHGAAVGEAPRRRDRQAIQTSNLGLNPQSDGTFIRIPVRPSRRSGGGISSRP